MKFFFLCLAILLNSCNNNISENITAPPKEDDGDHEQEVVVKDLVKDQDFQKGFKVTPQSTEIVKAGGGRDKTYVDTLGFGHEAARPVWQLAQWNSDYSLEEGSMEYNEGPDGSKEYSNPGKTVTLYPDQSLRLEINASQEYDGDREYDKKWPHLYISQIYGNKGPNVGEADSLNFSMQLKLDKAEYKGEKQNYDGTVHFVFFFAIRNLNKNSPDYKETIGFGIRSYDYRYTSLSGKESIHWDGYTNKYLYNPPTTAIWGNISFHDKQWHKAEVDLKPLILEGINAVRKKTDGFKSTSPKDLQIIRMNTGWEAPGIFDAAVRVKDISLEVVTSKEE